MLQCGKVPLLNRTCKTSSILFRYALGLSFLDSWPPEWYIHFIFLSVTSLLVLQCDRDIIIRGLYFDDRKGDTLVMKTIHEKQNKVVKEEHISLIQESESNYIGLHY